MLTIFAALRFASLRRLARVVGGVAACSFAAGAAAADRWQASLAWIGPHAPWLALALLGLAAVVLAAFTVRRPPKGMRSLGEMTTELREEPSIAAVTERASPAPPSARNASAGSAAAAASPGTAREGAGTARPPATNAALAATAAATTIAAPTGPPETAQPEPAIAAVREPAMPATTAPRDDGSQLFLALHHVDLSIDVLRRHITAETRPMPAVWLMLLDLARTHGREHTFRELAGEFHRRFNVRAPAWDGYPPDADEPGLEAYPRLVKEITLAWGTHECRRLLDRLLYDNRNGDRKGFTLNAYNDLIALRRAADAVIDTIEQDLAEEAKLRTAFASAEAEAVPDDEAPRPDRSPLVRDLESQLDNDLRASTQPASALEREHPALAGMLAREWGNAALSARLCEMLARGGDGAHGLSKEASDELALLRSMAERLSTVNGIALPGEEPAEDRTAASR